MDKEYAPPGVTWRHFDDLQTHYDLSDEFFLLFLDPTRTYSCAYFEREDMTLEDAQIAKIDLSLSKLRLEPGMTLLDIGCGWGATLERALKKYDVNVIGLTLSKNQQTYAQELLDADDSQRIKRVLLSGWEQFHEPVDRIVSIGAFESFSRDRRDDFFEMARAVLPSDGVMLLHTIVTPSGEEFKERRLPLTMTKAKFLKFLMDEIYPGGHLPIVDSVEEQAHKSGFDVTRIQPLRLHYARTFEVWASALQAHRDEAISLQSEEVYDRYMRYLTGCAELFALGYLDIAQFTMDVGGRSEWRPQPRAADPETRPVDSRGEKPHFVADQAASGPSQDDHRNDDNGPVQRTREMSPFVSPLVREELSGDVRQAVLADEEDRRVVLVELRIGADENPVLIRDEFLELFDSVFLGDRGISPPEPIGKRYVRCVLTPQQVDQLVAGGNDSYVATRARRIIERVSADLVFSAQLDRSVKTIHADAAQRMYGCYGRGVVWGVMDSGIDSEHSHFKTHETLRGTAADLHRDFSYGAQSKAPLTDTLGHGTHVAGIIAGQAPAGREPYILVTDAGDRRWVRRPLEGNSLSGVAPESKLVSLKVLDDNGHAMESAVLQAIDYVLEVNRSAGRIVIHGINLSFGLKWDPREYPAGHSPVCREIDQLVRSGVVAVVSAGNVGAGTQLGGVGAELVGNVADVYGQTSTITDPGNADRAITVGSTHREKPQQYGVTFNSSKGPTLDGRVKPDVVAPGERIVSAATGEMLKGVVVGDESSDLADVGCYIEASGTSLAAAHVSGAIAAFLSVRAGYVDPPDPGAVKDLFKDSALDLKRMEIYQGKGLINLMHALQGST